MPIPLHWRMQLHDAAVDRLIREVEARVGRKEEFRVVVRGLGAMVVLVLVIAFVFGLVVGGAIGFAAVLQLLHG